MSDEGRRSTVKEIITKYKLEPELEKTIYVEGSTDKVLVKWFLKQAKITNVIVNEINAIEIDINKVFELGLDNNARSRVITLTTLIDHHVIGIIDSDFDFISKSPYPHKDTLCKTDYACMEMYCFNEDTLEKILLEYPENKQPRDFESFKLMLSKILIDLFLIRYAKNNIEKSLPNLDFKKSITQKLKNLTFDKKTYLSKYVSNNNDLLKEFNTFIDEIKIQLPSDVRKIINGHDFVHLLEIYLGNKKNISLYPALEFDKLKEEEMFKKLLSFFN